MRNQLKQRGTEQLVHEVMLMLAAENYSQALTYFKKIDPLEILKSLVAKRGQKVCKRQGNVADIHGIKFEDPLLELLVSLPMYFSNPLDTKSPKGELLALFEGVLIEKFENIVDDLCKKPENFFTLIQNSQLSKSDLQRLVLVPMHEAYEASTSEKPQWLIDACALKKQAQGQITNKLTTDLPAAMPLSQWIETFDMSGLSSWRNRGFEVLEKKANQLNTCMQPSLARYFLQQLIEGLGFEVNGLNQNQETSFIEDVLLSYYPKNSPLSNYGVLIKNTNYNLLHMLDMDGVNTPEQLDKAFEKLVQPAGHFNRIYCNLANNLIIKDFIKTQMLMDQLQWSEEKKQDFLSKMLYLSAQLNEPQVKNEAMVLYPKTGYELVNGFIYQMDRWALNNIDQMNQNKKKWLEDYTQWIGLALPWLKRVCASQMSISSRDSYASEKEIERIDSLVLLGLSMTAVNHYLADHKLNDNEILLCEYVHNANLDTARVILNSLDRLISTDTHNEYMKSAKESWVLLLHKVFETYTDAASRDVFSQLISQIMKNQKDNSSKGYLQTISALSESVLKASSESVAGSKKPLPRL